MWLYYIDIDIILYIDILYIYLLNDQKTCYIVIETPRLFWGKEEFDA